MFSQFHNRRHDSICLWLSLVRISCLLYSKSYIKNFAVFWEMQDDFIFKLICHINSRAYYFSILKCCISNSGLQVRVIEEQAFYCLVIDLTFIFHFNHKTYIYLTVVIKLKLCGTWYPQPAFLYSFYEIPFDCAVDFFQLDVRSLVLLRCL